MTEKDRPEPSPESESTRVISQSFELEGIAFSWWAVDDGPSLVTVSSQWFGRKSEFCDNADEAAARGIAAAILKEHAARAEDVRAQLRERADRRTVR